MKKFNITVNGTAYEVEVEEVKAAAPKAPKAPAAPAPAPVAAPAPAAPAPAAPAAPAAAPAAGAAAGEAAAEKTSFNVVLTEAGDQKIKVIKVVRDATGLGLKEAKELVDGAPKTVKEGASKEEADELKAKFTEVGAVIELK